MPMTLTATVQHSLKVNNGCEVCSVRDVTGPTKVSVAIIATEEFSGLTFQCNRLTVASSSKPTTSKPKHIPTSKPTAAAPTSKPKTIEPTLKLMRTPTSTPKHAHTSKPTSSKPTLKPMRAPTSKPNRSPTTKPTTIKPTSKPARALF